MSNPTSTASAMPLQSYLAQRSDYQPNQLPLPTAQEIVLAQVDAPTARERLSLQAALGRVLAQDVHAPFPVPAHDNSAMDGFALRSSDLASGTETRLQVVGSALAGHPFQAELGPGQCIRIMTGAVIPTACDSVIAHEKVAHISLDEIVLAPDSVKRGANRRLRGEDLAQGELAMTQGTLLHAAQIGLLASLGIAEIEVFRRLKVAFFSTGDELQALGTAPQAGMLYDSNRYSMQALLSRLGCECIDLGIVQDQPQAIRSALLQAAQEADVVLTSGGMAGGDADFTRRMMQELGDVHFWQLQMRPGRPFAFGHLQNGAKQATLFGLPGNPVALMISFYMLVRPALLRMMGAQAAPLPQLLVASSGKIRKALGRHEFQRGIISMQADGSASVSLTGAQGSAMLSSMSHANCLLALPPSMGDVEPGQLVPVILLDGLQ